MGEISIRAAAGTDTDRLRRFLAGLSLETAYRRFFTGIGSVPDRLLRWLLAQEPAHPAGRRHGVAVVAVHDGEVVGHGMYVRLPGQAPVAELAIVVADAWQGHGIGPRLADAVLAEARADGVREIAFTVLADNRPANVLAARSWPRAAPVIDHGVYEYLVPLAERNVA
jgi:GNAT superfamily N-acetyltransferase